MIVKPAALDRRKSILLPSAKSRSDERGPLDPHVSPQGKIAILRRCPVQRVMDRSRRRPTHVARFGFKWVLTTPRWQVNNVAFISHGDRLHFAFVAKLLQRIYARGFVQP